MGPTWKVSRFFLKTDMFTTGFRSGPGGFQGILVHLVEDQYGEVWAEEIFRSNLDGSNEEKIGNAPSGSWGNIALDISVPTADGSPGPGHQ